MPYEGFDCICTMADANRSLIVPEILAVQLRPQQHKEIRWRWVALKVQFNKWCSHWEKNSPFLWFENICCSHSCLQLKAKG